VLRDKLTVAEKIIQYLLPVVSSLSLLPPPSSAVSEPTPLAPPEILSGKPPRDEKRENKERDKERRPSKKQPTSQLGVAEIKPPTGRRKSIAVPLPNPTVSPLPPMHNHFPDLSITPQPPPLNDLEHSISSTLPSSELPAPMMRRRTRSLLEVNNPDEVAKALPPPTERRGSDSPQPPQRTSTSDITSEPEEEVGWSQLDNSAAKIQRWYRYQKVRIHFQSVVKQALLSKASAPSKRKRTISKRKKRPMSTPELDDLRLLEHNRERSLKAEYGEAEAEAEEGDPKSDTPLPLNVELLRGASAPLRANKAVLFVPLLASSLFILSLSLSLSPRSP